MFKKFSKNEKNLITNWTNQKIRNWKIGKNWKSKKTKNSKKLKKRKKLKWKKFKNWKNKNFKL